MDLPIPSKRIGEFFDRPIVKTGIIGGSLVAFYVGQSVIRTSDQVNIGGLAVTAAYLLFISVFYLTVIDWRGRRIREEVGELEGRDDISRLLRYEPEVKSHFEDAEWSENVSQGIFLEYSAWEANHMWEEILENGGEVYLLVKRPDTAIDADVESGDSNGLSCDKRGSQEKRIMDNIEQNMTDYTNCVDRINLLFYTEPAGIRGRLLDDDRLYIGWYNFGHDGEGNEPTTWGHCHPMLYITDEHDDFDTMDNFFVAMGLSRAWETADRPVDLLDEDDLDETPKWLRHFIEGGYDTEERVEFLKKISPENKDIESELDIKITVEPEVDTGRTPAGYREYE